MADRWSSLANAVACRLEWERLCGRGKLLTERSVVRAVAEFAQSTGAAGIDPEHENPDLPGTHVDLVVKTAKGRIRWAMEVKWVCTSRGVRQWDEELMADISRLQHFTTGMAPKASRLILVCGHFEQLQKALIEKRKNVGGPPRQQIMPSLLPTQPGSRQKYKVRRCGKWLRPFYERVAADNGRVLPSTYDAKLVGCHRAGLQRLSVVSWLWLVSRPRGWASFEPASEWKVT